MCLDSSYTQCSSLIGTFLSSVCCFSADSCIPISNGTETTGVICCEDPQGCATFAPISCDLQLQNITAHPQATVKTIDFSPLESCNGKCCPHGYSCNGTTCLHDDENSLVALSSALTPSSVFEAPALSTAFASSATSLTIYTSPTSTLISSIITPSIDLPSSQLPTSVMQVFSTETERPPAATSLVTEPNTPLPTTTPSSASEAQATQDKTYKKLIVPISVVAVVAWLLLVFAAWKILKRRKRASCEKKNQQSISELPSVHLKGAKKSSFRFELPALPRLWELPATRPPVELPATPVRILSVKSK